MSRVDVQPRLLLLDEPFSALDSIARMGLYDLFERLRDLESVTTVLVTHDVGEAVQLADHLVVLKDGVVQQSDPVDRCCNARQRLRTHVVRGRLA